MDPLASLKSSLRSEIDDRYADTKYTDGYVAFLDILGMKNLLDKEYPDIRRIFNAIEASVEMYKRALSASGGPLLSQHQVRLLVMSDSIVISVAKTTDQAFPKLIGICSCLINGILHALDEPVFVRGGIAGGDIYQDRSSVFGPALSEAYRLETEVALSMRCIVSKSLYSDKVFLEYIATPTSGLVKDPKDGMYFIKFAREENFEVLLEFAHQVLGSDAKISVKNKYNWLVDDIERKQSDSSA